MKLKIRIDSNNPGHTMMTLFMGGANCGQLVMLSGEAFVFINTLRKGADASDLCLEVENESKFFSDSNSAEGCVDSEDETIH